MKKIILSAIPTLLFFISYAQVNKGSVLLGGGVGFLTATQDYSGIKTKAEQIFFSPSIGFAIKQNTILGIELSYLYSKDNTNSVNETTTNQYGGSVFMRKYLGLGKGFYFFGQANAYFRYNNYENSSLTAPAEYNGWAVGVYVKPGVAYALTKKFHVELGLTNLVDIGYSQSTPTYSGRIKAFSLNASLSSLTDLNVGFRLFLSK